jgi:NIPSNAP
MGIVSRQTEKRVDNRYDVTIITVKPNKHPEALPALRENIAAKGLLACWYSDLGALNQILIIRKITDEGEIGQARLAQTNSSNPFGIGELIAGMASDSYVSLELTEPLEPGEFGPFFEVRTYMLKSGGLPPTVALWRKSVPGRVRISPLLAAMVSLTGPVTRFIHIWPYRSLDERARLRAKAIAEGVWPPPGGPSHVLTQQSDIYLPAAFSPIR